jgi:hypothetical protein
MQSYPAAMAWSLKTRERPSEAKITGSEKDFPWSKSKRYSKVDGTVNAQMPFGRRRQGEENTALKWKRLPPPPALARTFESPLRFSIQIGSHKAIY